MREFERRAIVYQGIDARLRYKTRFFAAACVTNQVLAQLVIMRTGPRLGAPRRVSERCGRWLAELGGVLEKANLDVAAAISTGSLAGPSLDTHIVTLEQSVVQNVLFVPDAAPLEGFSGIEFELDSLLNPHWLASIHHCRLVRWYSRVLGRVRSELRSPLQFSRQFHREKIGVALIESLSRKQVSFLI